MPYAGGKAGAGVFQRIVNQIPPLDCYIEPFAGGAAVLRALSSPARSVAIDLDPRPLDALARAQLPGLELYQVCGVEWLRHAFGLHRYRAAGSAGQGLGLRLPPPRDPGPVDRPPPDPAAAAAVAGSCGCDVGRTLVYADPPYPRSSRKSRERIYRHEMTDADHVELLRVLKSLPCLVIVSSYTSPLYEQELAGWRRIEFTAQTRRGPAQEVLWLNYPEPDELHDYRYLGANKRQRERIRRKVRTWAAGLKRLPHHERAAIVEAITGR